MKDNTENFMRGAIAIMVTARNKAGELDETRVKSHVQFLLDNGLRQEEGAIVATGSIGECAALSEAERTSAWEASVESSDGEVPIIAGINHTDPDQVIRLGRQASEVGADGVMIMTPYYWNPSKRSVRDFFAGILSRVELPVLLYNNIPATQMDLPLEIITELANHEKVKAIKECTPNFIKLERVYNQVSDQINVINGNGEFWEPYASLMGCHGFVSGLVNFAPQKTLGIMRHSRNGNYEKVFSIKKQLAPYFDFFFEITERHGMSVEPALLKEATSLVGSPVGPVKPPVTSLNKTEKERLRDALMDADIISQ